MQNQVTAEISTFLPLLPHSPSDYRPALINGCQAQMKIPGIFPCLTCTPCNNIDAKQVATG